MEELLYHGAEDLIDHGADVVQDCSVNDEKGSIVHDKSNQRICNAYYLFHNWHLASQKRDGRRLVLSTQSLLQRLHTRSMVFVILCGFLLLALLTTEVVNHSLDCNNRPRQKDNAEAASENVAQHRGNNDLIHCLLPPVIQKVINFAGAVVGLSGDRTEKELTITAFLQVAQTTDDALSARVVEGVGKKLVRP